VVEDITVCQDRDERNDCEKILVWKNKILFFIVIQLLIATLGRPKTVSAVCRRVGVEACVTECQGGRLKFEKKAIFVRKNSPNSHLIISPKSAKNLFQNITVQGKVKILIKKSKK
jgi:hypothetical protein